MAQNPEATVVFGVLNETSETESRVALTPDIVTRLKRSGCLLTELKQVPALLPTTPMRITKRPVRR